jgi:hypothetical protein
MAGNIARVEVNLKGINEMMSSSEVRDFMQHAGEAVAQAANQLSDGDNFKAETKTTKSGWIGLTEIFPNGERGEKMNLENNTMLKAAQSAGMHMSKGE